MQLSDFYYDLPDDLIARYPLPERSASRLLVLPRKTGAIEHQQFTHLINYLAPGDCLVFNNSRVIPARLFGHKVTGGKVELLIERILNPLKILAHIKTSKTLKPGATILLAADITLQVIARQHDLWELQLSGADSIWSVMDQWGHMPLPPYFQRPDEPSDQERYQTVYAHPPGSVAAPTAGLHFDTALLKRIQDKGIQCTYVTLHVGAGTFQPVRTATISNHTMHREWLEVTPETCKKIIETKERGNRVIAVGTTSVRSLETAAHSGTLQPYLGDTTIFIYPGYSFKIIDGMITNFHLPESTLLMLVSAFAGRERVLTAYQEAIRERYRFFSYGDAMLIL